VRTSSVPYSSTCYQIVGMCSACWNTRMSLETMYGHWISRMHALLVPRSLPARMLLPSMTGMLACFIDMSRMFVRVVLMIGQHTASLTLNMRRQRDKHH